MSVGIMHRKPLPTYLSAVVKHCERTEAHYDCLPVVHSICGVTLSGNMANYLKSLESLLCKVKYMEKLHFHARTCWI